MDYLLGSDVEKERCVSTGILEKRAQKVIVSNYMDLQFLLPTSNHSERLSSHAEYFLSNLRQNKLPSNLEEQFFFKVNHRFWNLSTVNNILN